MSDLLTGLGLEPAPADEPATPAVTDPAPTPEPTPEPAAPAATPEPTPDPDDEIVVPEGAENPDAVRNAIKAERNNAKAANARARDLERQLAEREDAARPLEERLADADRKAKEAETKALRLEVGIAHGLSLDLADRLKGGSKEEMEADAKSLLSSLSTTPAAAPAAVPSLNGGVQPTPPVPTDPSKAHDQLIAGLARRGR